MDVDLAIIGSGGGAFAAAIAARRVGRSVLMVERGMVGGTCVNTGCVPSKALLAAAEARHVALAAGRYPGIRAGADEVAFAELIAGKAGLVAGMQAEKYVDLATEYGWDILRGQARFVAGPALHVEPDGGGSRRVTAEHYLVATGSAPWAPSVDGLGDVGYLTSTSAMELATLPASLLVIGGGYVGLEQAQLFAHLGVQVTVVGRFAPHTEPEIAAVLRGVFADDGIEVVEERGVSVAPSGSGGVVVRTGGGAEVTGDRLLFATGRSPNTATLGLDRAGVRTDDRGFVVVDAQQRSSNPGIFAAGDVSGAPQYVYVAARTGHAAAAGALGEPTTVDYRGLPGVTFTTPQLGSAGLTEAQALERGHDCDCRVLGAQDIPRALANRDTRGAVKLVIDADTRKVLGVHAALDGAGDVMLAATYAIKFGLTVDDIADTWAPYLTMSEALRIAAGLFRSDKPTSCCA